jgi:hypothetical protein
MKSQGVEYEERMARLAEVEPPRPGKEWLYDSFDRFRVKHPWVGSDNVAPKSIARDLFERVMTFREYVQHYGLKRSEGVLLRYLSDTYKALIQNIPDDDKTDDLVDVTEWLGEVVRHVDSSLLDEWDRLRNPAEGAAADIRPPGAGTTEHDVTANRRAFTVMVRNEAFRWVELLARRRYHELPIPAESAQSIEAALTAYWDEFDQILLDADARSSQRFVFDPSTGRVVQILHDPDDVDEWRLAATVDRELSRSEGKAVLTLAGIGRAGDPSLASS